MKVRKVLFLTMFLLTAIIVLPNFVNADAEEIANGIKYSLDETTATITGYTNEIGDVKNIPSTVEFNGIDYTITAIGDEAFFNCNSLTSIIIPDSITTIGELAFYGCESLTSITIPDSVTSIGLNAFGSKGALTTIYVNEKNENYSSDKNGVLFNKDKTKIIKYPDGRAETTYEIPNSVITIEDNAFWMCDSLESITIPDSVKTIGDSAFFRCSSLISIIIPDSVETIGSYAFRACSSLTSITIPSSVKEIETNAFELCPHSLTIYGTNDSKVQAIATDSDFNFVVLFYPVKYNLTNISCNGKDYADSRLDFTINLKAKNLKYKLLDNVNVFIGENQLPMENYDYNASTGDLKISAAYLTGNITIEAYGEQVIFEVIFGANGGNFADGTDTLTFEDWQYTDYDNLEKPTRKGYKFLGYYNEEGISLDYIMGESGIYKDMTFYAEWEKLEPIKLFEDSKNQEFIIGTHEDLTFILDNDRGNGKVYVDDKELSEENGDYVWHYLEGTYPSIMLSEDYMKALEVGEHTIKFVLDDGREIETTFTVVEKEVENEDKNNVTNNNLNNPATGDNIEIYVAIFIVSVLGTSAIILKKNKRQK